MREFLKAWNPKELKQLSKDDRADLLADYLRGPQSILDFHQKKGHRPQGAEEMNLLFDKMSEKMFPKTIIHMLKIYENTPDLRLVTLMVKFLEKRHAQLDNEVIGLYAGIIDQLLEKPMKRLMKKADIDDYTARELLGIVPDPKTVGGQRFVGIYVGQMARRLYAIAKGETEVRPVVDEETGEVVKDEHGNVKTTEVKIPPVTLNIMDLKQVRKMFATLFGKDMLPEVATSILLERREFSKMFNEEQLRVWRLLTIFALTELEKLDKEELNTALTSYIKRRAREDAVGRDSARRIVFDQVSNEEFPRIMKAVNRLRAEGDNNAKYL